MHADFALGCSSRGFFVISCLEKTALKSTQNFEVLTPRVALPENRAGMAASKFIFNMAIQSKLRQVSPSELLADSNLVAKRLGR
jgi:hypothetical protein